MAADLVSVEVNDTHKTILPSQAVGFLYSILGEGEEEREKTQRFLFIYSF